MTHPTPAARRDRSGSPWRRATLVALTLPTAALTALAIGPTAPARANAASYVDNPGRPDATQCVVRGANLDCTVSYNGHSYGEQQFVLPYGASQVRVEAVGGSAPSVGQNKGGRGAVVSGAVDLSWGRTYYVEVGSPFFGYPVNGGGASYSSSSGGDATDLRAVSKSSSSSSSSQSSLTSRVIVAGGGGSADVNGAGGDAGRDGSPGTSTKGSVTPGQGGTQTAGGAAGVDSADPYDYGYGYINNGSLGQGGIPYRGNYTSGGSGGGGYYGGGAGLGGSGGGGGSSLVPEGGSVAMSSTFREPSLTVSYTMPIAQLSLTGDGSTTAGRAASFATTITDGFHTVAGTDARLSISPSGGHTGAACTDTGCSATQAGDYTVTSRVGKLSTTKQLHVDPGPLSTLALSPATASVAAGAAQAFSATGTDEFGNALGDVTDDATFTYRRTGDDATQPCDVDQGSVSCQPAHGGSYTVSASVTPKGSSVPVVGSSALSVAKRASTSSVKVADATFGADAPKAAASVGSVDSDLVPTGAVSLSVDEGEPQSAKVGPDGSVEIPGGLLQGLRAGAHTLRLAYAGNDDLGGSTDLASFLVRQARTTTTVSSTADGLSAVVTGADPTGEVEFYIDGEQVGTGTLEDGVATWTGATDRTTDAVLAAVYTGDEDHLSSAGSTARRNPTITATPSTTGWTSKDVTITFACTGVAENVCPDPVTVDTEGVTQPKTQTITSPAGGVASITPAPVRIDRTAPTLRITGPNQGGLYNGAAPAAACHGEDGTGSGVADCTVTTTGTFGTVVARATATDAAGNAATTKVTYRVRSLWVDGAEGGGGTWTLKRGTTALLHVIHDGKLTVRFTDSRLGSAREADRIQNTRHWLVRVSAKGPRGNVHRYLLTFPDGTTRTITVIAR